MKRSIKIAIAVVVLIVIAGVTMGVMKGRNKNVTEVTTGKVEQQDLVSKVTANGQIEAKRKVDLSANIMGQITNLAVREGDVVKKGDFLLQIDRAQHAASAEAQEAGLDALLRDRDAARASAEEANLVFQRSKRSFEGNLIPQAEYERARAALQTAQANVAAAEGRIRQARASLTGARDTLSKTTIRAPMDGLVTRLPVEEGEVAVIGTMNNPGTVLLTISDMSVVEAVMEVDETDIPNVKIGQKAEVTIDAWPNQRFSGTVTEVGSSPRDRSLGSSTDAVNFEVKIQLDNPPPQVRPGFSCSAEITTASRTSVVTVPIQAVVIREKEGAKKGADSEEEGVYLFDAKEQKVKFQSVKTGISGETSVEVLSGVAAGQEIVTGPFKALRDISDGAKVKLQEEKGKGKGGPAEKKDA